MESISQPATQSVALSDAALKFMEIAGGVPETTGEASPPSKWQHPPSFYCPISQQCLHDPVVLSDGHTYERRHIERWLQEHNTSPVSNEALPQKAIFPNHALRNAIEEYFEQVFSVHRRAIRRTIRGPETSSKSLGSNEPLLHTIDALMQCSFLMNADLSTEAVLRQIMDEAKTLLGAEVASVFLVDSEKQELYSNVNSTGGELRVPITAGIAGHVASTGEPLIIHDVYMDKRFNRTNDMKTGFRTRNMMCVPLTVKKGIVLGVVQLINKTSSGVFSRSQALAALDEETKESECLFTTNFTLHDLQFLQVFASQAATAVSNSGGVLKEPELHGLSESEDSEPAYGVCNLMKSCIARPLQKLSSKDPAAEMQHQEPESSCGASVPASAATCSAPVMKTDTSSTSGNAELQSPIDVKNKEDLATARKVDQAKDAEESSPKQTRWRSRLSRSFSKLDEVARDVATKEMLKCAFNSWEIDAFALARLTDNKPLSTLGMHLFHELGLVKHFDLEEGKVHTFFTEMENGYDDANPYHNRAHAASVLHAMHALLDHGGIIKVTAEAFDDGEGSASQDGHLVRMACLVAAAMHDFEHLGVTNDFLVRIGDKRALLHNDQHVNENHHVAAAFAIMSRPECNFLSKLPQADWSRVRKMVIELVISTDMAKSGTILKSFNEAFGVQIEDGIATQPVPTSAKDATLLLHMAIKCADLGHLALSWDVHQQWVSRLEEEFFAQGDREKARGYSVSFLMDRNQPGCSKTQTGFFKFVVIPLFRSLVSVVPRAQPVLDQIMANCRGWQKLEEAGNKDEDEQKLRATEKVSTSRDACHDDELAQPLQSRQISKESSLSEAASSNIDSSPRCTGEESPENRRGAKRSGRARQRAAKWWAGVRRKTPSPEQVSPRRCALPR